MNTLTSWREACTTLQPHRWKGTQRGSAGQNQTPQTGGQKSTSGEETPSGSAARSCSTGGGELHSQVLERSIKEQPITAEDQGQVREEDGRKKNASRPSYLHQGLGHKKPRPAPQMEALHLSMYAESKNEMMSLSET